MAETSFTNPTSSVAARWRLALLAALVVGGLVAVRATPLGELLTGGTLEGLISQARETWWAPLLLIVCFQPEPAFRSAAKRRPDPEPSRPAASAARWNVRPIAPVFVA